jgi:hypothetical protein
MKSLAENRSLRTLTLSGNVLDSNASKAVSYALAYNRTIRKLYVDHCSSEEHRDGDREQQQPGPRGHVGVSPGRSVRFRVSFCRGQGRELL